MRPKLFLTLCCVALGAAAAAETPSTWRAGTGRENITPPPGLWMTGFAVRTRPADGTAQDLWVKALAFADPAGNRGVMLTADLCGIGRESSDRVCAEIARQHGLPRAAILINVSHTHCAPALPGVVRALRLLAGEDERRTAEYARELETKMIRAAGAALGSLAPATLSWGEDEATFGFNRRENPIDEVPARRAAGTLRGPFEPRVPVLAVRDAEGALRALLVSYACHNTTLRLYQWHGDYAGSAQVEIERRHPGVLALFALGCGGDINPGPRGEIEQADQYGRELADAADRALAKGLTPIAGRFAAAMEDIELRLARMATEEEVRTAREKDQPFKEMHQAWAETVAAEARAKGEAVLRVPYPVQVWNLGGLPWIALGGEVVVDYSIRLRREIGRDTWVLGYSNDVMAYIPSERVLAEGRYEGATSMVPYGRPSPWAPGLEDQIVKKAHELVGRVAPRSD